MLEIREIKKGREAEIAVGGFLSERMSGKPIGRGKGKETTTRHDRARLRGWADQYDASRSRRLYQAG